MRAPTRMFLPPDEPGLDGGGDQDGWLLTWADAITVLLGFFVLLFAFATMETERFERVRRAISSEARISDPLDEPVADTRAGPDLARRVTALLGPMVQAGQVEVVQLPRGVIIDVPAEALFGAGATLREEQVPTWSTLAWELRQPDMVDYLVEVQGLDAWGPAGDRALALARFLHDQGVPEERLRATAFGGLEPVLRRERGGQRPPATAPRVRLLLERP